MEKKKKSTCNDILYTGLYVERAVFKVCGSFGARAPKKLEEKQNKTKKEKQIKEVVPRPAFYGVPEHGWIWETQSRLRTQKPSRNETFKIETFKIQFLSFGR